MGQKRPHAQINDGFAKPSPAKDRMNSDRRDKKDKRKSGEVVDKKPALVWYMTQEGNGSADVCVAFYAPARMARSRAARAADGSEP
jgi:hypothetical protein